MQNPETVLVKSSDPKTQGPCVAINKEDYDEKVHKLYKGDVPEASEVEEKPKAKKSTKKKAEPKKEEPVETSEDDDDFED